MVREEIRIRQEVAIGLAGVHVENVELPAQAKLLGCASPFISRRTMRDDAFPMTHSGVGVHEYPGPAIERLPGRCRAEQAAAPVRGAHLDGVSATVSPRRVDSDDVLA